MLEFSYKQEERSEFHARCIHQLQHQGTNHGRNGPERSGKERDPLLDGTPGYPLNESAKSYQDLAAAREEIVNKVYDIYGYWLEQEPVEIINPPIKIPGVN